MVNNNQTPKVSLSYEDVVKQIIDTEFGVYDFFKTFAEEYSKFHNHDCLEFSKALDNLIVTYRFKGLF